MEEEMVWKTTWETTIYHLAASDNKRMFLIAFQLHEGQDRFASLLAYLKSQKAHRILPQVWRIDDTEDAFERHAAVIDQVFKDIKIDDDKDDKIFLVGPNKGILWTRSVAEKRLAPRSELPEPLRESTRGFPEPQLPRPAGGPGSTVPGKYPPGGRRK